MSEKLRICDCHIFT